MAARLSSSDLHLVQRFSAGITPALAADVKAAGSARKWWDAQLAMGQDSDPEGEKINEWYPDLWHKPKVLWERSQSGAKPFWELMYDFGRWTMMRRVHSQRQVHEVMTEFWSNLLHVSVEHEEAWPFRITYDRVIRKHALGSFEKMLLKTIVHPSMGLYLDNATSTKDAPNENLGREVLELHTVGLGAKYTEDDVLNASRLLTGWRVDLYFPEFRVKYIPEDHWVGPIKILGFTDANKDPDGRAATKRFIRYLARHPVTAERIARRLCVRFVNDNPSDAIVNKVAAAYKSSGTNVKAMLKAMIEHPEFAASAGKKVRMPNEDLIAAMRAVGVKPKRPSRDESFANQIFWLAYGTGQTPYSWPSPDGFPEADIAWSSPARALTSFRIHKSIAAQQYPNQDVDYAALSSFLPPLPAPFKEVVRKAGRRVLGEPPSADLKASIAIRTGIALDAQVNADDMSDDRVKQLLVALLDSPQHMMR